MLFIHLYNTPKQQGANPKQYIQNHAKNCYKLLLITANRPFKTLPHSIFYFSPRSYHQITISINNNNNNDTYIAQIRKVQQMQYSIACQRIHVIFTSGCKPTHSRVVKHRQLLPKQ